MRFSGKSVLITGGTSGLGAATARAFSTQGANVAFCGREPALGEAVLEAIEGHGVKGLFSIADVRDAAAMAGLVREVREKFGGLDIAVNCAGRNNPPNRVAEIPVEEFRDVIDTNLTGVFNAMRAEIPELLKTKGVVINVASVLSAKPSGWMAAYSASKTGVVALSTSAAEDYRKSGLRIYAFSPGPMATPMFDQALKDIGDRPDKYAGGLPAGGVAMDPVVAAAKILDLADPETAPGTGGNFIFG